MDTCQAKGYEMSTQGTRIREARERLGLTQEEFAKRCGVHRRSQLNYEMDRRHPSEAYLDALDGLGVDSIYIMSGAHRTEHYLYPELFRDLLVNLLGELGYSEHDALISLHVFEDRLKEITPTGESTGESSNETDAWAKQVAARQFRESSRVAKLVNDATELDSALLGEVLAAVDAELGKHSVTLTSDKRGRLVASTYRNAKVQGRIDSKLLAEAVSLAA